MTIVDDLATVLEQIETARDYEPAKSIVEANLCLVKALVALSPLITDVAAIELVGDILATYRQIIGTLSKDVPE